MALILAEETDGGTPISQGSGSNPVDVSVTLDNTGGTTDSTVKTIYLVATTYTYSSITLSFTTEDSGIDWVVSLDNSTFTDTVEPPTLDASGGTVYDTIYYKAIVNNNSTVTTGTYTSPDARIVSTEA